MEKNQFMWCDKTTFTTKNFLKWFISFFVLFNFPLHLQAGSLAQPVLDVD